jgi:hypothetical protein
MAKKAPSLHWQTFEYELRERSTDWFWAVGIISIAVAITAIIFNNVLFAIVILIGGFALSLYAARPPKEIDIVISDKGILLEKYFYPYRTLESFWVEERGGGSRILVKSQRLVMPYIVIPINEEEADIETVKGILRKYLPEVFHSESIFHRLMEYLGF